MDGPIPLSVDQALFSGNFASASGGAIYIQDNSYGPILYATFNNVTISDNYAGDLGGGIVIQSAGEVTINNSILWGNDPDQIMSSGGGTMATIRSSRAAGMEAARRL